MSNNNYKTDENRLFTQSITPVFRWLGLSLLLLLSGCVKHQYQPAPIESKLAYQQILSKDHQDNDFKAFLELNNHSVMDWPVKEWQLSTLTLAAIYFNPEIELARSGLSVQMARETIAGQRPNPTLGIPLEYHSETGESPWLIGIVGDFLFERSAKREARRSSAIAKTEAARINLEQQAWFLYNDLHQNLTQYISLSQQKKNLIAQQDLLEQSLGLLERRQELGQVSPFEVSSTRLELQQIQLNIVNQDFMINDAFHKLIAVTGLQSDKINKISIDQKLFKDYLDYQIDEIKQLREEVLTSRYDVRIKLKEYQAMEAALKLEIEKQYPDINLSPGFIFEQGDRIWALGAAWVLPLFHNNEGQILEALALREKKQSEFIAMQTRLINSLDRIKQNYHDRVSSYQKTLVLLEALQERDEQINKQFELGYVDKLAVVRSRLELEKANQALLNTKLGIVTIITKLEDLKHSPFNSSIDIKTAINHLLQLKYQMQP